MTDASNAGPLNDIYRTIQSDLDAVESSLKELGASSNPLIAEINRYLFEKSGKRIRPALLMLSAKLCGYEGRDHVFWSTLVEIIHTASLIHDDILDGSDERRGQPAAHLKFGTNLALLTGDMLIFAAFDAAQPLDGAVSILNAACRSMCLGEVTEDRVASARLKGGALLGAAAELGALAAGAPGKTLRSAGQYGEKLGTAYQLRDNQLDEEQGSSPRRFADDASSELAHLPASCAKDLLVQLTRFAWQRTR